MATATAELPPGYWIDERTGAWQTIPWPADPDERFRLASHSLGPLVIDWAEGRLESPGLVHHLTGRPWRFTPGQKRFLILWYLLGPGDRWRYRSGVKRGAKGTGKDPFGAALCLIELLGPARFAGWSPDGLAMGESHRLPLVQIAANSESQAKDVLRVANAMLPAEARAWYGIDAGETRTVIDGGGRLELLTSSERSSEGDPATFIMVNETHHMTASNGGLKVAQVARRNVGKSPAELQSRLVEFTNAHERGADSVAENSYEAWQLQAAGKARRADILYDSIEAPPGIPLEDEDALMAGLRAAYADSPWSDLDRTLGEIFDSRTTVADTIRYYLNGLATAEDAWVEPHKFDDLAHPELDLVDGDEIAMFLDCSKSEDATGLVACRLSDGHVVKLGGWQRPRGRRGEKWLAPRTEVDRAVVDAFTRYTVCAFAADPSPARDDDDEHLYWAELIDEWHRRYAKHLKRRGVWASPGVKDAHSVRFDMRTSTPGGKDRVRDFTAEAEQTAHDIDVDAALTWDGDPMLRAHVHNAKRRSNPWGVSLGKVTRDSSKLVDLAVCLVGARLFRRRVLNAANRKRRTGAVAGF